MRTLVVQTLSIVGWIRLRIRCLHCFCSICEFSLVMEIGRASSAAAMDMCRPAAQKITRDASAWVSATDPIGAGFIAS